MHKIRGLLLGKHCEIWGQIGAYFHTKSAITRLLGMSDLLVPSRLFPGRPLLPWQRNLGYFHTKLATTLLVYKIQSPCCHGNKIWAIFAQTRHVDIFAIAQLSCYWRCWILLLFLDWKAWFAVKVLCLLLRPSSKKRVSGAEAFSSICRVIPVRFLADRTNGRAIATVLRLSSSVTWCIVAKRCILEQKLQLRAYMWSYMRNRMAPK